MSIETKNEISIAKIQTDIGYMKSDIQEIKTDIKSLKEGFVTRTEYIETRDRAREEHASFVTKEEFKPFKVGLGLVATSTVLFVVNTVLELIKFR